jgi:hypothetical protein
MTSFTLVAALAALAACSDGGPGSTVAIRFATAPTGAAPAPFATPGADMSAAAAQDIALEGSNGRLTITDIRVIVEELELEPVETGDCDDDVVEVECPDFEQRWFFVQVPVDGTDLQVAVTQADGRFDEVEFEVGDAEVDDDDADDLLDAQLIEDLFNNDILPEFPNWPEKASMVIVGTFEPKNPDGSFGAAQSFETYFEAEIEVEFDLIPPFDTATDTDITIVLHPDMWFGLPDGTVMDLAALQGQLLEFELEFEDGLEIEIDD